MFFCALARARARARVSTLLEESGVDFWKKAQTVVILIAAKKKIIDGEFTRRRTTSEPKH
jgi:hypothetical protein